MKRTILAAALLASAALHANSVSAQNNVEILTKMPDAAVLQNSDKAFQIDAKFLLSLLQDPDPALNNPDKVAWEIFVEANKPSASAGKVIFETWPSNDTTFDKNATCPSSPINPNLVVVAASELKLRQPALLTLAPRRPGLVPHVVAGGGEEVRRNPAAHNFIVCNKLNTKAGLKAAFTAGKPISFPLDSIEVKGFWIPVDNNINASNAHVGTVGNQTFALVALHVISKQVPNWTWATFEHEKNPGRCDYQGCFDKFGATKHVELPKSPANGQYPACNKTTALKKLFTDAKLEAVYENYCLKGSQTDFTTSTGIPTLVGNSRIEDGFIQPSSCMTCHARAAFDKNGAFLSMGMNQGPVSPSWFYTNPGTPQQKTVFLQGDFVWALRNAK